MLTLNAAYNFDALDFLRQLDDESVHAIITSPPYYGLRDYGTSTWEGGDPNCSHPKRLPPPTSKDATNKGSFRDKPFNVCPKCGARRVDKQVGLEPSAAEYVARMVAIFAEARRVLRSDGNFFLNLGDSYSGSGKSIGSDHGQLGKHAVEFIPVEKTDEELAPKNLMMIPHRVAIALQMDGWIVRQDNVWNKPNQMPHPVIDRTARSHEYVFHLVKSGRNWYDHEAVLEPYTAPLDRWGGRRS